MSWGWRNAPQWLRRSGVWAEKTASRIQRNEDPEDVLKQRESILATQIRIFGLDGGPAVNARRDTAIQLERMGRYDEAVLLRQQVFAAFERNRGEGSPDTLDAEERLAETFSQAGRFAESQRHFMHVHETAVRTLGPEHAFATRAKRRHDQIKDSGNHED